MFPDVCFYWRHLCLWNESCWLCYRLFGWNATICIFILTAVKVVTEMKYSVWTNLNVFILVVKNSKVNSHFLLKDFYLLLENFIQHIMCLTKPPFYSPLQILPYSPNAVMSLTQQLLWPSNNNSWKTHWSKDMIFDPSSIISEYHTSFMFSYGPPTLD